jgi:hypothetical protein
MCKGMPSTQRERMVLLKSVASMLLDQLTIAATHDSRTKFLHISLLLGNVFGGTTMSLQGDVE